MSSSSNLLPITWVRGRVATNKDVSNYKYRNHSSGCGDCLETPMTGNNYYCNSSLEKNLKYSVNDKLIAKDDYCGLFCNGCPGTGCGLNFEVCPNIGGIQSQVQWDNISQVGNTTEGGNSTVACLYPLASFNDLQTVLEYQNQFGETDDYMKVILPQFCGTQTSIGCPEDPGTGQAMRYCSRFVSKQDNNPCPDWLSDTAAADLVNGTSNADQALLNYCRNYNSPDCLCINRFNSPVYQIMSLGQSADTDACWWLPCKDSADAPSRFLVPRSLPACLTDNIQVCNDVNIAVGGSSSNLSFNPQLYTDCDMTNETNNGGDTNNTTNEGGFSYWWIILIVIILIVIVVLLLIFIR